jgi:hypothetical protein
LAGLEEISVAILAGARSMLRRPDARSARCQQSTASALASYDRGNPQREAGLLGIWGRSGICNARSHVDSASTNEFS